MGEIPPARHPAGGKFLARPERFECATAPKARDGIVARRPPLASKISIEEHG
jgi:hypothetical protein